MIEDTVNVIKDVFRRNSNCIKGIVLIIVVAVLVCIVVLSWYLLFAVLHLLFVLFRAFLHIF